MARAGRAHRTVPAAGCTHLVPFSHQNEVNFLPKADTAVGKPGQVSGWCSDPGPPPPWAPNCGTTASQWLHPAIPKVPDSVSVQKGTIALSPSWEQPSPSVSLPACSAAPPGRILEKTLSPSPPGCPVAMPAGPRGPAALGPALLSAGGQTKLLLPGDRPGWESSAKLWGARQLA